MIFKKLHDVKTSAPLKSSDRRKLKQRIVQTFALEPDVGDILVPEPLLSLKFTTHLDGPGVVYLSSDGDPLWFSLGKSSNDLIPTVYTLWKHPELLPVLSTPSSVIPVLMGGADLMIPGVVKHPPDLVQKDLVAVRSHMSEERLRSPPIAVGRMAIRADELRPGAKGKAVHILHTHGDSLWNMGSKADPPSPASPPQLGSNLEEHPQSTESECIDDSVTDCRSNEISPAVESPETTAESPQREELSSSDITGILRTCTIHAIKSRLSKLPISTFPIPSSTFYSNYILPSRPQSSLSSLTPIDIKHSSHKNLTSFLKSLEKEGLLRLKDLKGDLNILSINASHEDVKSHRTYMTLGDWEKMEKRAQQEEKAEREKPKEIVVREFLKPHAESLRFFEQIGSSVKLYSVHEIREIFDDYLKKNSLVNPVEQQYIHPDELLLSVLVAPKSNEEIPFIKRDEAMKRFMEHMQSWHELEADGKDTVLRKGQLKPISVVAKSRQGRKVATLITGFEDFFITPEFLRDELRRICATSTSVSRTGEKGNFMKVRVQGKQIKAVTSLLVSQGVPNKWINAADLSEMKK